MFSRFARLPRVALAFARAKWGFLPLLLAAVLCTVPLRAANIEAQNYRRANSLLAAGHAEQAEAFAHGHDPILNKVLRSAYMAQPGNNASFEEMAAFVRQNPGWPNLKGITAIAEQKLPEGAMPAMVDEWFAAHPPVTLAGFYRAVDALDTTGQAQAASDLMRMRWIEGDFSGDELTTFRARFARSLGPDMLWARLDHLLWKNDAADARRLYPYADSGMQAVAEARIALAQRAYGADARIERVPSEWQNDPGLLYERLRQAVRENHDEDALDILNHAPEDLRRPELWWEQRQIMVRRLMDRHEYDLAYRLASAHNQTDSKSVTQAEFLAGWLALRFLDRPEDAEAHFEALYDKATTPISRARGAYWIGRACEARGDRAGAELAYQTASALNITYYGQLAAAQLDPHAVVRATPEPTIPGNVRAGFYDRDEIKAVEHLYALGEKDLAHLYFHAAAEAATTRVEFALLTELAYRIERPDFAIEAAKAANQKNMLMASGGFPLLDRKLPEPPEPAFTHALIRQESMFNPDAESPVGARGLMQLMSSTARAVARKLHLPFRDARLGNSDYNLRLGTSFVQSQIESFDGSYVLALAGYNAGPRRVREWMAVIGDPRRTDVDAVDWIEEIPVPETRNYVQRILESLQIYRARLNGGTAPLLILKDLKR